MNDSSTNRGKMLKNIINRIKKNWATYKYYISIIP